MEKKILFVITKSNWGGAQRYVYDLATHIPRNMYSVIVAAGGNGLLCERLNKAQIPTVTVSNFERDIQTGKEFRAFFELLRLYKKEKPDVIHLNSSKAGGIGALAGWIYKRSNREKKPRIIFTAHGWGFGEERPAIQRLAILLASLSTTLFVDAVICVSKKDFDQARKFVSSKKVVFIPNAIVPRSCESKDEARKKLSLPFDNQVFVYGTIAELTPNKGHYYLTRAFSLLKKSGIPFKAVWIGDGELFEKLKDDIDARGLADTIFLTGFIEHAETLLPACDAFILPSLKEGFPYTILEAMHAGVPIVSTRIGGVVDMIKSNHTGILVEPKNSEDLFGALERIYRDRELGKNLTRNAKKLVETSYTFDAMRTQTFNLYERKS